MFHSAIIVFCFCFLYFFLLQYVPQCNHSFIYVFCTSFYCADFHSVDISGGKTHFVAFCWDWETLGLGDAGARRRWGWETPGLGDAGAGKRGDWWETQADVAATSFN